MLVVGVTEAAGDCGAGATTADDEGVGDGTAARVGVADGSTTVGAGITSVEVTRTAVAEGAVAADWGVAEQAANAHTVNVIDRLARMPARTPLMIAVCSDRFRPVRTTFTHT